MSKSTDDLILHHLIALRADLAALRGKMTAMAWKMDEQIAYLAETRGHGLSTELRLNRHDRRLADIEARLTRIEHCLNLAEAPN